jgi:hypothetical protein
MSRDRAAIGLTQDSGPPDDDDRAALASWGRTARYCLIELTRRAPALAAVVAWLAGRR